MTCLTVPNGIICLSGIKYECPYCEKVKHDYMGNAQTFKIVKSQYKRK